MQNRSIISTTRTALFAGVSSIALIAASPAVMASDLPTKAPVIARAPVPQDRWTWWVEGGAFNTGDPAFGPFPFLATPVGITPKTGWEAAIGFDYSPASFAPYHISGQFRYGAARRKSQSFPANVAISSPPGFVFTNPYTRTTSAFAAGAGSAEIKEHHWLVDFAVGREFQLGSGQAQAKLGVRVADIYAKVSGSGAVSGGTSPGFGGSTITGVFSFTSRSKFLGVGPRLSIDGGMPFAGRWSLDYSGGVAVLFGNRSFDSNSTMTLHINPPGGATGTLLTTAASSSDVGAVFNLDAQAGVSYWFTPTFKMTASYRFDGYWNALRTVDSTGAIVNEDRFYHGPMLRATLKIP
jgi:Legionella pneumophila major outer membrane protein precursor